MSIIAKWSGAGIADGTAMAATVGGTGDTKFDVVTITGGSSTVKSSGPYSPRIEMIPAGAASNNFFYWQTALGGGSFPQHSARFYLELASIPTANGAVVFSVRDTSNVLLWYVDVSVAGIMRLRNQAGTSVAVTQQPLSLSQVYRIEAVCNVDFVTVYIYRNDSQIPIEFLSASVAGAFTTALAQQVRIGTPNNAHLLPHMYIDEIAFANTADLIGPTVPGPSSPWSIWDGTTEKALVEYGVWDGAALQYYADTPYLL